MQSPSHPTTPGPVPPPSRPRSRYGEYPRVVSRPLKLTTPLPPRRTPPAPSSKFISSSLIRRRAGLSTALESSSDAPFWSGTAHGKHSSPTTEIGRPRFPARETESYDGGDAVAKEHDEPELVGREGWDTDESNVETSKMEKLRREKRRKEPIRKSPKAKGGEGASGEDVIPVLPRPVLQDTYSLSTLRREIDSISARKPAKQRDSDEATLIDLKGALETTELRDAQGDVKALLFAPTSTIKKGKKLGRGLCSLFRLRVKTKGEDHAHVDLLLPPAPFDPANGAPHPSLRPHDPPGRSPTSRTGLDGIVADLPYRRAHKEKQRRQSVVTSKVEQWRSEMPRSPERETSQARRQSISRDYQAAISRRVVEALAQSSDEDEDFTVHLAGRRQVPPIVLQSPPRKEAAASPPSREDTPSPVVRARTESRKKLPSLPPPSALLPPLPSGVSPPFAVSPVRPPIRFAPARPTPAPQRPATGRSIEVLHERNFRHVPQTLHHVSSWSSFDSRTGPPSLVQSHGRQGDSLGSDSEFGSLASYPDESRFDPVVVVTPRPTQPGDSTRSSTFTLSSNEDDLLFFSPPLVVSKHAAAGEGDGTRQYARRVTSTTQQGTLVLARNVSGARRGTERDGMGEASRLRRKMMGDGR